MRPTRFVIGVGATIGLCILGDSLMYSILPLEADRLGIALPLVGVLLSANRLIRLLSNSWAGAIFARQGPRRPFTFAVLLSLVTTATYAVAPSFGLFLVARMLWGVAWSNLRQGGYVAIWTGRGEIKGRLTGLLWGLVRLGSALSVLIGGLIYDRAGYGAAVTAVAGATALAIPAALLLPWRAMVEPAVTPAAGTQNRSHRIASRLTAGWRDAATDPARQRLVVAGMVEPLVNGIVLSTTSLFLAQRLGDNGMNTLVGVGTLAGLMLGARWMSDMLLGPFFGALSDRFGQPNTAAGLVAVYAAALIGVITLPVLPAVAALLLVLLCDGGLYVVLSAAASGAALHAPDPYQFVGVYTTAADAGSAVGPLLAFSLAATLGFPLLYAASGLLLLVTVLWYWRGASSGQGR